MQGFDWINIHSTDWQAKEKAAVNDELHLLKARLRNDHLDRGMLLRLDITHPGMGPVARGVMMRIKTRMNIDVDNKDHPETYPVGDSYFSVY
jgi:hypothetical protein